MRDLKFRMWNDDAQTMAHFGLGDINDGVVGVPGACACLEADRDIMQYTGLHDKNGKEIFEGDVLDSVWTQAGDKRVVVKIPDIYWMQEAGGYPEEAEVIGNIHENPELLEGT